MKKPILKLCYVDGDEAYFTTQALDKQWGDDWNDVPYEHNAEPPYAWRDGETEPKWEIVKIKFDSELRRPCDGHTNSPFSVEAINRGAVAWLESQPYERNCTRIFAGTSLSDFMQAISSTGGKIYMEVEI